MLRKERNNKIKNCLELVKQYENSKLSRTELDLTEEEKEKAESLISGLQLDNMEVYF